MNAMIRNVRFPLAAAGALAVAMSVGAPVVVAADTGWYAGGAYGQSKRDISAADVASDVQSLIEEDSGTVTAVTASVDKKDSAWKVFGGYRVNRHFAVEAGYTDLGKIDASATATLDGGEGGAGSASFTGNAEVKSWSLAVIGSLPVTDNLSVYGKLGIQHWRQKLSATMDGMTESEKENGTDPLYGVGVSYSFTKQLAMRAEWERYKDVGESKHDIDLLSLGLLYNF